jgi:ferredoxin
VLQGRGTNDELENLCHQLTELRGRLEAYETLQQANVFTGSDGDAMHVRLTDLEMRNTGTSYCAGNVQFTTLNSVINWLRMKQSRQNVAMYWDLFSLVSKTRHDAYNTTDYAADVLMATRVNKSKAQLLIESCLSLEMPLPFLGTSNGTSLAARALPTIKSFAVWSAANIGFGPQLTSKVYLEASALLRMLPQHAGTDVELMSVATHLVTSAQLQWISLQGWMSDFYHRLGQGDGLSDSECWGCGLCVRSCLVHSGAGYSVCGTGWHAGV